MGLLIALDKTKRKKIGSIFAIVAIEENVYARIRKRLGWVDHVKEIPSKKKNTYLEAFPKRFEKIRDFLYFSDFFFSDRDVVKKMMWLGSKASRIVIDDALFGMFAHLFRNKIERESKRNPYLRPLILLADGIVNCVAMFIERFGFSKGQEKARIFRK